MSKYLKLMKAFEQGTYTIEAIELTDLNNYGRYPRLMREKYETGFTQIIINAFLMIEIMESLLKSGKWVLVSMQVSDSSVNAETLKKIHDIFNQIKESEKAFAILKDYLLLTLDEQAIFIDQIVAFNPHDAIKVEIHSNGLLYGTHNELLLDHVILPILDKYLNGQK